MRYTSALALTVAAIVSQTQAYNQYYAFENEPVINHNGGI
jgi:hypothetical protein